MTEPRIPRSTYRLQITAENHLHKATAAVPYLARLGVDWAYLSPILESEPGSDHGYDVVDHGRTDTARGGRDGLAAFSDAAHSAGLGVLADIVPNHVGVATPKHSVWWWDVLTKGQESEFAHCFDIDWDFGQGRLRVPILGDRRRRTGRAPGRRRRTPVLRPPLPHRRRDHRRDGARGP